ncbi:MAG TPA: signal peptide peptidase SppA [Spirochaetia bacterium]|nr:signal peptide peptidase SppA [Spirochaetia bacterium]
MNRWAGRILGGLGVLVLVGGAGLVASRVWGDRVAVVRIDGVITEGRAPSFWNEGSGAAESLAELSSIRDKRQVKAVVLRLNSPGGSAAASQEIAREVEGLRAAGKKVVASMGDVSASGAYWIACSADRIVADPATVTGSIGVITRVPQLGSLYRRMGIEEEVVKSGKYKDMGSPGRPLTGDERRIFEAMVGDVYGQFVDQVAGSRHLPATRVRELADGRIFTGRQGVEAGLVDSLGTMGDAVRMAGSLAGIKGKPQVVEVRQGGWWPRGDKGQERPAGGESTWRLPGGVMLMMVPVTG